MCKKRVNEYLRIPQNTLKKPNTQKRKNPEAYMHQGFGVYLICLT